MALRCPRCGTVNQASANPVCTNCGFSGAPPPVASGGQMMMMAPPQGAWASGGARIDPPRGGALPSGGADPDGPPMPGRLRPIPIGKTIALGIVTLGMYVMVRSYKSSGDLHRLPGGWGSWQTFFWLQLIPYAGGIFGLILYFQNNKVLNARSPDRGLKPSWTPFILAVIPFVNIAAPFVWASAYNDLARRT